MRRPWLGVCSRQELVSVRRQLAETHHDTKLIELQQALRNREEDLAKVYMSLGCSAAAAPTDHCPSCFASLLPCVGRHGTTCKTAAGN